MRFSIIAWDLEWSRRNFYCHDFPEFLLRLKFDTKSAAILLARAMSESKPWVLPQTWLSNANE
jgi:hypothetical protein